MSRNLEKEYKELVKEEMPDLWGRIEAGLEPKQTGIKKRNLWRKYVSWGMTAAAACLCLAVAVPFFLDGDKPGFWDVGDTSTNYNDGQQSNQSAGLSDGSTSDFEGIYNEAQSSGTDSFEDGDYGNAGAEENYGPAHEAEKRLFKIRGQVIEVSEEEGISLYTVLIEETEEGFEAGEIIVLKDVDMLIDELEVGEVYQFWFDNMSYSENTPEYWIYDVVKK